MGLVLPQNCKLLALCLVVLHHEGAIHLDVLEPLKLLAVEDVSDRDGIEVVQSGEFGPFSVELDGSILQLTAFNESVLAGLVGVGIDEDLRAISVLTSCYELASGVGKDKIEA